MSINEDKLYGTGYNFFVYHPEIAADIETAVSLVFSAKRVVIEERVKMIL